MRHLLSTLAVASLYAGIAVAQQSEQAPPARQAASQDRAEARAERRQNTSDEMFAQCLAIDNTAEIQIAEFAAQRLQNEQVKQFAQQLVRDHQALVEKLTSQHGADAVKLGAARDGAATTRDGNVSVEAGAADVNVQVDRPREEGRREEGRRLGDRERRVGRDNDRVDFAAFKQELAAQCVKSAEEELAAKPANEIDRCFVAAQIFGHQHMLSALTVMERHASPELKETLTQASQTTQKHLDHAKQLMKSLESEQPTPATSGTTNR